MKLLKTFAVGYSKPTQSNAARRITQFRYAESDYGEPIYLVTRYSAEDPFFLELTHFRTLEIQNFFQPLPPP
jgi:hypothetical protein